MNKWINKIYDNNIGLIRKNITLSKKKKKEFNFFQIKAEVFYMKTKKKNFK